MSAHPERSPERLHLLKEFTPPPTAFRRSWTGVPGGKDVPVDTWATSEEREAYKAGWPLRLVLGVLVATLLVIGWLAVQPDSVPFSKWRGYGLLLAAVILMLCGLVPYFSSRAAYRARVRATTAARVNQALEELVNQSSSENSEKIDFVKLYQLNRRQLDAYQEITKKQQRSTFYLTQAASVMAFLALMVGVLVAVTTDGTQERALGASLSALGGLLSGFLARTFFKAHRQANKQLNRYYEEPQRTGTYLAAERLARYLRNSPENAFSATLVSAVLGQVAAEAHNVAAGDGSTEPDIPPSGNQSGAHAENGKDRPPPQTHL